MTNKKTAKTNFSVNDPIATVLVVEDQPLAARMARKLLQEYQCASDEAITGGEALAKSKSKEYDLILMDIGLPDMDGFEVTRCIREYIDAKTTPIIALTGHISSERKQSCLDAGMQDIISKPLDIPGLKKALGTYVFPLENLEEESEPFEMKNIISDNEKLTIDLEEGMRLAGGKLESAKEMIALLANSLPKEMDDIQQARDNTEELYAVIHRIYGGLCYCGTPKLRKLVRDFKEELLHQNFSNIEKYIHEISCEAQAVISQTNNL